MKLGDMRSSVRVEIDEVKAGEGFYWGGNYCMKVYDNNFKSRNKCRAVSLSSGVLITMDCTELVHEVDLVVSAATGFDEMGGGR